MVFAYAGDSTITRFVDMWMNLVRKETPVQTGFANGNLFKHAFFLQMPSPLDISLREDFFSLC